MGVDRRCEEVRGLGKSRRNFIEVKQFDLDIVLQREASGTLVPQRPATHAAMGDVAQGTVLAGERALQEIVQFAQQGSAGVVHADDLRDALTGIGIVTMGHSSIVTHRSVDGSQVLGLWSVRAKTCSCTGLGAVDSGSRRSNSRRNFRNSSRWRTSGPIDLPVKKSLKSTSNKRQLTKRGPIKMVARTALVSLCSAAALGFVGAPGAMASTTVRIPMVSTANGLQYTVQKNDSLIGIANRAGVSLADLLAANRFTKSSVIVPGQVIKLPDHASAPAPSNSSSGATSYTVKKGDSLTAIAARVKVSLTALLNANKFTKASVIHPGQVITLPSGAILPASTSATSSTTVDAPATSSAPSEKLETYKVQKGDSLIAIASKAKVSLDALLRVNGFTKSSVIHPGQTINLPIGAATPSTRVQTMIAFAKAQVGKPYLFGAAGPNSYDCSGLVRASFAKVGVSVPHQSRLLAQLGTPVDWKNSSIQAGDLIFTYSGGDTSQIGHVAIAISATEMVEALSPGKNVSIARIPSKDRIVEVRRLL